MTITTPSETEVLDYLVEHLCTLLEAAESRAASLQSDLDHLRVHLLRGDHLPPTPPPSPRELLDAARHVLHEAERARWLDEPGRLDDALAGLEETLERAERILSSSR